ncbi:MAG: putative porin, partial [Bacteroidota bacterium]|nr:putative porin [Bacteroidota bacterium]
SLLFSSLASAQVTQLGDQALKPKPQKTIDKDSLKVVYFFDKVDSLNTTTYHPIDTLITDLQHYHPNFQPGNPMASQGNTGEASYPLIFKPTQQTGFDFGRHAFDPYLYYPENIAYYVPKRPFTVLYYVSGKSKEQIFDVTHGQSIAKGLYIGVDYRITNSIGNYDRQQTDEYAVSVNLHYSRPDVRYKALSSFTTNLLKVNESGGLQDISYFEQNREQNRVLLAVNLTDANNIIHQTGAYLHHSFYLGKMKQTRKGNSFWDMIVNTFNAGSIGHIFQYDVRDERYVDNTPNNNFYNSKVKDTLRTNDSIRYTKINNTFYWTNQRDSILQVLTVKAGIKYELDEATVHGQNYSFNQASPFGEFTLNAGANIDVFGKVILTTGGYNGGDQNYSGGIRTHFGKSPGRQIDFVGEVFRTQIEPGYFYHYYQSNIDKFNWNNSLVKTKTSGISASLNVFGLKAAVNFYNISDFVYLDTASIARQSDQTANILQLSADYSLHLAGLTFRNTVTGQNIAGTNYIRLPQLVINSMLSYRLNMFKSALQAESGIEMLYTSAFKGNEYNPALSMYRLQDNTTIGDYPYFDVFANLKIKHTRFFLKYQHFNAGYLKYRYYFVPGYPQNDAAFKFGISWIFYN